MTVAAVGVDVVVVASDSAVVDIAVAVAAVGVDVANVKAAAAAHA